MRGTTEKVNSLKVNSTRDIRRQSLPFLIEPSDRSDASLSGWIGANKAFIAEKLATRGAVLLRGFDVGGVDGFEQCITLASDGDLAPYIYRSTPRTQINGKIYTATEYPANQTILQHNENAYSQSWPMKLFFYCVKPADTGGDTPIADSREVYRKIESAILDEFVEKKVMYVRNYGKLDLSWQDVFQTTEKGKVEEFCAQNNIRYEWVGQSGLKTWQICQAIAYHPTTKEPVWFNQAHLFHISALDKTVQQLFLSEFGESGVPRNAFFGDGSPIDEAALDVIREVYRRETVQFPWQANDVLIADNMLVSHGRMPFSGERKVLVGMSEMMTSSVAAV